MKKLAAILALVPALAFAEPAMLPSHAVSSMALGVHPGIQIELLAVSVTTTTSANNGRTRMAVSSTGSESAPTLATDGLSLTDIGGVVVMLQTTGTTTATAGGTLQAYTYNVESGTWNRVPDLDLTAIAATNQSWPAIYVPVSRGRVTWVPNGIGVGTGPTVYMVGQVKPAL